MLKLKNIDTSNTHPTDPIVYLLIDLATNTPLQYVTTESLDSAIFSGLITIDENEQGTYFIIGTNIGIENIYSIDKENEDEKLNTFCA